MDKIDIGGFVIDIDSKLSVAMQKIDDNSSGIVFVTNKSGELCGAVSDGDIRRWILKEGTIDVAVLALMNKEPKYLFVEDVELANEYLRKHDIRVIPVIDHERRIVNIIFDRTHVGLGSEQNHELEGVPVVIMAGGKGTRLYPYTKILPKPLIPIGDTPIIERILNCFNKYGINKYYVTVNYKKGMIKSYFSDLNPDYELVYVEENKPLGTGGSIKLIEDKFDKPIFVANCDALVLADYTDLYKHHVNSGNDITVVSALKNTIIPYGVLHTKENGELVDMEEKPEISYLINTGMYVVNPDAIELIPDDTFFHMTHLVELVKAKGGKVGMYPVSEDSFLDMGEFDEMHRMERKLHIEE